MEDLSVRFQMTRSESMFLYFSCVTRENPWISRKMLVRWSTSNRRRLSEMLKKIDKLHSTVRKYWEAEKKQLNFERSVLFKQSLKPQKKQQLNFRCKLPCECSENKTAEWKASELWKNRSNLNSTSHALSKLWFQNANKKDCASGKNRV